MTSITNYYTSQTPNDPLEQMLRFYETRLTIDPDRQREQMLGRPEPGQSLEDNIGMYRELITQQIAEEENYIDTLLHQGGGIRVPEGATEAQRRAMAAFLKAIRQDQGLVEGAQAGVVSGNPLLGLMYVRSYYPLVRALAASTEPDAMAQFEANAELLRMLNNPFPARYHNHIIHQLRDVIMTRHADPNIVGCGGKVALGELAGVVLEYEPEEKQKFCLNLASEILDRGGLTEYPEALRVQPPIVSAAWSFNLPMVELLAGRGARLDARNQDGENVNFILQYQAEVQPGRGMNYPNTPEIVERLNRVRALATRLELEPSGTNLKGETPSIKAALNTALDKDRTTRMLDAFDRLDGPDLGDDDGPEAGDNFRPGPGWR